jgi:hypothetical protein
MYLIEIDANSNPFSSGWSDPVTIRQGDKLLFSGIGSTCPNPVRPSTRKNWKYSYGWIKAGIYNIETVVHHTYGRCVIINGGGAVLARFPNVNHEGSPMLTEVFIHEGNRGSRNPQWRGSAGCPTLPPFEWDKFVKALPDGKGVLVIRDSEGAKC